MRRRLTVLATLALCGIVAASCSSLKPKALKHYKSARFEPDLQKLPLLDTGTIRLTAFVAPVATKTSSRSAFDLSDEGQAEYVKSLAAMLGSNAKPSELAGALATPIRGSGATSVKDQSVFKRQFVVSVENAPMMPADRLERSEIAIEISNAHFKGWNRLATQYATVDLGDLTFSQENNFTLGAELAAPQIAELAQATASAEFKRGLSEALELSRRYRVVSGSLTPGRAVLVRQGVPGIDLTGNTVVEITIEAKKGESREATQHSFSRLFKPDGSPVPPAETRVSEIRTRHFADACQPVTATVRLDFILRSVTAGETTYLEGDDEIVFERRFTGVGELVDATYVDSDGREFVVKELDLRPVVVVSTEDLILRSFVLQDPSGRVIDINRGPGTDPVTLHLTTWRQAFDAIRWLQANRGQTVQSRTFYLGNQPIRATTDLSAFQPIRTYHNEGNCLPSS